MRNIDPRGDKQQLLIPCPCTTCLNYIEHEEEEVQFHLFKYEIDQSYTKWDKHREKDEQATAAQIPVNATTEFVDDTDLNIEFGSQIPTDRPAIVEMVNATKDGFSAEDLDKFQELLLDAKKPLYKGCPDFTKLSAIVTTTQLEGILEDLRWHATWRIIDGVLCHPADSQAWRTIDDKFPEIAEDPRNLRLRISDDGVDVNTGNRHHIEMISIFLEPLVDDLHTLFDTGVDTYDASTKDNFNLRAVVLWTINDYLALGTLCGYPYSGFKGCVVCGKETYCV
ncbi:putative reverse transcriptase domain-containing protein [Tanacetum coccineum]